MIHTMFSSVRITAGELSGREATVIGHYVKNDKLYYELMVDSQTNVRADVLSDHVEAVPE